MVRLEVEQVSADMETQEYFNSKMVRLEDIGFMFGFCLSALFQFQNGTIRRVPVRRVNH